MKIFFKDFFSKIVRLYFERESESAHLHVGQGAEEKGKIVPSGLHAEPGAGLDPTTLRDQDPERSRPDQKPRVRHLTDSATQVPQDIEGLLNVYFL